VAYIQLTTDKKPTQTFYVANHPSVLLTVIVIFMWRWRRLFVTYCDFVPSSAVFL